MSFVIDATQTAINTDSPPQRIVSLVPSTTESICALQKSQNLKGVTRFCTDPAYVRALPKIGGTKNVDVHRVLSLSPCLVLANKEENTKETIQTLRDHKIPVYVAFPKTVDHAIRELQALGTLLHRYNAADKIITRIQKNRKQQSPFRYVYLIWKNPLMTISNDCFIASMMQEIGGQNALAHLHDRYPVIDSIPQDIDVVLLSSEPYPFRDKHRHILSQNHRIPIEKILLIDGSYCSWHGSRIEQGLQYLHRWRESL